MTFDIFKPYEKELFCAVSDRHGGVSPAPYNTLNIALHVGDQPVNVLKNRTELAFRWDFLIENLIYMDQTHSDHIQIIEDTAINKIENCDAIITAQRNIPLMVMVADCIPMMIYDPKKRVIGAVHAGRNGTFLNIGVKTIRRMQEHFGTDPADVRIALGPSIHVCCYEVGPEIADIVQKSFENSYIEEREGKTFLNLQQYNVDRLQEAGVKTQNIEVSPVCTCCDKNYFSYRREGVTGRFAGVIKLK